MEGSQFLTHHTRLPSILQHSARSVNGTMESSGVIITPPKPVQQHEYDTRPRHMQFTASSGTLQQHPGVGITVASQTSEPPCLVSPQAVLKKRRAQYSDTKCEQCRKDKQKVCTLPLNYDWKVLKITVFACQPLLA